MHISIKLKQEVPGLRDVISKLSSLRNTIVCHVEVTECDSKYHFDIYAIHKDMAGSKEVLERADAKEMLSFSVPIYFRISKKRSLDPVLLRRALREKIRGGIRQRLKEEVEMGLAASQ